ncbi:MAG: HigA family addiction module antidote protein [Leptolyngbya sp. SIO4C1]|nr:HigA family addiction module antidote protein [Leptolyngbya sp. SIO4C1]
MMMHNPMHPGEFISTVYLEPAGISARTLAEKLDVNPSTVTRLLNGKMRVSEEMALRLHIVLGRTPESWLTMQNQYSLWQARQRFDSTKLSPLEITSA